MSEVGGSLGGYGRMPKLTDKGVVLKRIAAVRRVVEEELRSSGRGFYARGLSSEGFVGGYLQALDDVEAALRHGFPSDHRGYWRRADFGT